jgi:hypothetical protein
MIRKEQVLSLLMRGENPTGANVKMVAVTFYGRRIPKTGLTRKRKRMRLSFRSCGRDDGKALLFCGAGAEEGLDARNVRGNIDFDSFIGFGFADGDAIAVFHPTKLLELLDAFEFAGRECGKFEKRIAAKCVETDMLEMARGDAFAGVADPGNGRTGKIKSVAVEIGDNFDDVGIHDFFGVSDWHTESGDVDFCASGDERIDGGIDDFGMNEGKIALDIDVDVRLSVDSDFGEAIGAGAMFGARHNDFAAERFDGVADAIVVGGDDDARSEPALLGALVNVLNHGAAGDGRERLPGKTRGSVARWDDDENRGLRILRHKSVSLVLSRNILPRRGCEDRERR